MPDYYLPMKHTHQPLTKAQKRLVGLLLEGWHLRSPLGATRYALRKRKAKVFVTPEVWWQCNELGLIEPFGTVTLEAKERTK